MARTKKHEVEEEFVAETVSPEETVETTPDEEKVPVVIEVPVLSGHVPGPSDVKTECTTCKGSGAVPENIVNGKVDKWKDCPDCIGGYQVNSNGTRYNPTGNPRGIE